MHGLSRRLAVLALASLALGGGAPAALAQATGSASSTYFPPRHDWARAAPAAVGMDADKLAEAVRYVQTQDNPAPRDQALALAQSFGAREPHFGGLIGPTKARAPINGIVVRRGKVVAEWGDTASVDMSHSVAKTFLTTVLGLAVQDGLIRSVNDKVGPYMPPGALGADLFASEHNAKVTWDHLLRQTSDWQGTLWGKPDWADRPEGTAPDEWANRKLHEPGTRYKYNDVRVNLMALAALQVWRQPLPEVLKTRVMDPIGASSTWRWVGYDNSWIELDGQRVQSVSGGGHWGGGMFINAWDLARFGYLFMNEGRWNGRQLIAPDWIRQARTPGVNAEYGYANWFLNTNRKPLASTPASTVTFRGNGQNIVYLDWENELLVVVRWIGTDKALDEFLGQVIGAISKR